MSGIAEVKRNIPFSPPDISEAEINEVAEALRSGWITTGPKTKQLEQRFAEYLGVKKCVCLNSQTACSEMALRFLGVGEGDEVIVPSYTFVSSALAFAVITVFSSLFALESGCSNSFFSSSAASLLPNRTPFSR